MLSANEGNIISLLFSYSIGEKVNTGIYNFIKEKV
jgi:hypothetical protein